MAKEINIKIDVDTKGAENSVDDLKDSVDDLNESVDDLNETTDELGDGLKKAGKDGKDGLGGLPKIIKTIGDAAKTVGKKGLGALKAGFKGVGTAIKAAGIGIIVGLFITLKEVLERQQPVLDLLETSVNAISIVINEVGDALSNAFDSATEATGGFDAVGKVFDSLIKIGKNLFTLLLFPLKINFLELKALALGLKLGFEELFGDEESIKKAKDNFLAIKDDVIALKDEVLDAAKGLKDGFVEFGENIGEAVGEIATAASSVVDELAKIDAAAIINEASRITQLKKNALIQEAINKGLLESFDRQAEQQRQIRDDETKTFEERIVANNRLGEILEEQEKQMLKNAAVVVAAAQAELRINNTTENRVKLIEAQNEQLAILATVEGFRSEQIINQIGLQKEQNEALEENIRLEDEKIEQQITRGNAATEAKLAREILIAESDAARREAEIEAARFHFGVLLQDETLSAQERENLNNKLNDSIAASDKKFRDSEEASQKLSNAGKLAGAFSTANSLVSIGDSLVKIGIKNEAFQKTLAVAQIAIDTAKGISNAVAGATAAAAAAGPGAPALIGPFIAAGIASVLSGIAGATAALSKAGGTSASSASSASITRLSLPSPPSIPDAIEPSPDAAFTQTELFGTQAEQIGGGAGQNQIRAFVVEKDVTDTQNRISTFEERSTLG